MNPVVRVLFDRAQGRRLQLLQLADSIPEDYWARHAPGDSWAARHHLVHTLSADELVERTLREASSGAVDTEALLRERSAAIERGLELDVAALLKFAAEARQSLGQALERLAPEALGRPAFVVASSNQWSEPVVVSVVEYLGQWSKHDADHEAAIRSAIATTPDLTAIALSRRPR